MTLSGLNIELYVVDWFDPVEECIDSSATHAYQESEQDNSAIKPRDTSNKIMPYPSSQEINQEGDQITCSYHKRRIRTKNHIRSR
uniref:Uncharacterized protein n=1 Tax=Salix viminalis TaxID=40686 RepID=A0A6N2MB39_SALVM